MPACLNYEISLFSLSLHRLSLSVLSNEVRPTDDEDHAYMKQVFLLFCMISVLPVSQKISTTPVVDTNQLKQSDWYSAATKSMAQSEKQVLQFVKE